MPNNKNIIAKDSTEVIIKRSQSLLDITKDILKNSKREVTVKQNQGLTTTDDNFILIKAGNFMMGSNENEREQPIHKVTIEYDFYMSKYQLTMKEYLEFAKETDSHHPEWMEEGSSYNVETGDADHYKDQNFNDDAPVIGVSWEDATEYCEWRSQKEDKTYRLPTEAEWEYACRAGTTTRWSFGDEADKLKEYAWYADNANGKAHPVGDKKPNPCGLHDMHGNIWEWCEDVWAENYDVTPRNGSANKGSGNQRVLRGGSWINSDSDTRSSFRDRDDSDDRSYYVGFRLVLQRTLP